MVGSLRKVTRKNPRGFNNKQAIGSISIIDWWCWPMKKRSIMRLLARLMGPSQKLTWRAPRNGHRGALKQREVRWKDVSQPVVKWWRATRPCWSVNCIWNAKNRGLNAAMLPVGVTSWTPEDTSAIWLMSTAWASSCPYISIGWFYLIESDVVCLFVMQLFSLAAKRILKLMGNAGKYREILAVSARIWSYSNHSKQFCKNLERILLPFLFFFLPCFALFFFPVWSVNRTRRNSWRISRCFNGPWENTNESIRVLKKEWSQAKHR